jgi:hypothetical protein
MPATVLRQSVTCRRRPWVFRPMWRPAARVEVLNGDEGQPRCPVSGRSASPSCSTELGRSWTAPAVRPAAPHPHRRHDHQRRVPDGCQPQRPPSPVQLRRRRRPWRTLGRRAGVAAEPAASDSQAVRILGRAGLRGLACWHAKIPYDPASARRTTPARPNLTSEATAGSFLGRALRGARRRWPAQAARVRWRSRS